MIAELSLHDLSKKYETFQLENVSFQIPKGYITGFIGRNGSGKTTTIKSILQLIHYEGLISFDDRPMQLGDLQDIGVIMDEPLLAKDWDMNLVNQAMKIGYKKWHEQDFFAYLERFNIDKKLKVKELSRGMKIKLMLSIALSHEAHLLILDEPTSGLDPDMRDELMDILKQFVEDENHTVLFSTHITSDLEQIADFIVFIDKGKLVRFESVEALLEAFQIYKGTKEEVDQVKPELILGRKDTSIVSEILVEKSSSTHIPEPLIQDQLNLDKLLILYGRKQK